MQKIINATGPSGTFSGRIVVEFDGAVYERKEKRLVVHSIQTYIGTKLISNELAGDLSLLEKLDQAESELRRMLKVKSEEVDQVDLEKELKIRGYAKMESF